MVSSADIWLLLDCLSCTAETICLAQVTEELNSGFKFHEAVKDKPNTLLLPTPKAVASATS